MYTYFFILATELINLNLKTIQRPLPKFLLLEDLSETCCKP